MAKIIEGDGTFVAENFGYRRIMQNVLDRSNFAVDQDHVTDQANSVAVVGIVNAMDGTQGLNRLPWPTMPTVNGNASQIKVQPVRNHEIFFVPRNQFSQLH